MEVDVRSSCLTRYSRGMEECLSSQVVADAALLDSDSSWACSVIKVSPVQGLSWSVLSSCAFSATSSISFTSTRIAATRAVFRPPSAMRLETRRSVINFLPGAWAALASPDWTGSRVERARALSSAVGRRSGQAASRTACAAVCTVLRTPSPLASSTTLRLRPASRAVPGARPRLATGTPWWQAASSCRRRR